MSKRKQAKQQKVVDLDSLKQINLHAAGLDIGDAEIWACVPSDRTQQPVRCFKTFTVDLHTLADWLSECNINTVAMESTGIYWIPIYEILDDRGFEVKLVNAHHLKNVPGRKSDVQDCQWIQQLHTFGLLRGSFHPDEQMRSLRAYTRHRANLIQCRSQHIQHMQKALQLMNLKLTKVISDITGQTGLKIIRAIVAGEHNPIRLAKFRNSRCRKSETEIAKSLNGNYKPEHLFALQQALEAYDFYTRQIQACDQQLQDNYQAAKPQLDLKQHPLPPARRTARDSNNCPDFDLRRYLFQLTGVDLTQIDGINTLTAQTVLTEIGLDMTKWPSVKHFTSWLTLCPYQDISGGKVLNSRTKPSNNRAAAALRMAAQALAHSHSPLGDYYRLMRARHGPAKAITATAHKLARIIYHMLKHRQPFDPHRLQRNQRQLQQRRLKRLKRQAKQLGFKLVETT
jgi:transposase